MGIQRSEYLAPFFAHKIPLVPLYGLVHGVCTCGKDCGKNAGKHPSAKNGVHSAKFYTRDTFNKDENVGAVCGKMNTDGWCIIVLDIDPRNGGLASLAAMQKQYGKLPTTWCVATGGGGYHYYYKSTVAYGKSELFNGIDIQGSGLLVVAPGSTHLSGRIYDWEISPDEADLADIPVWLAELLAKPSPAVTHPTPKKSRILLEEKAALLEELSSDNRDEWVNVGMALHSINPDAFDIWDKWSAKSAKYNAKECAKIWKSFKPKPGGISHLYIDNLYIEQLEKGTITLEYNLQKDTAPVVEADRIILVPLRTASPEAKPMLDILQSCPVKLIKNLAEHYLSNAMSYHENMAIASAIATVSSLAQGNFVTPFKNGSINQYVAFVADAGCGKERYYSSFCNTVDKVCAEKICATPASPQALKQILYECNCVTITLDEIIRWLKGKAQSKFSADDGLITEILSLWGGKVTKIKGIATKSKENATPDIENPCLSMVGCGTKSKFIELLKNTADLLPDGTFSRFDFILADYTSRVNIDEKEYDLPPYLEAQLKYISGIPFKIPVVKIVGVGKEKKEEALIRYQYKDKKRVAWDDDVAAKWKEFFLSTAMQSQDKQSIESSILNRRAEKVLRIASTLAIAANRDEPCIDMEIYNYAMEYQMMVSHGVLKHVCDYAAGMDTEQLTKRCAEFIISSGKNTLRELKRNIRAINNLSLEQFLSHIAPNMRDLHNVDYVVTGIGHNRSISFKYTPS